MIRLPNSFGFVLFLLAVYIVLFFALTVVTIKAHRSQPDVGSADSPTKCEPAPQGARGAKFTPL